MGHEILAAGRGENCNIFFSGPDVKMDFYQEIDNLKPDVILNLIAATDVDECERLPRKAYELNSEISKIIANTRYKCKDCFPHLIYISSDQVYSGPGPHMEFRAKPCNIYGASKFEGERWFVEAGGTIMRTNFVGASKRLGRNGFTDWLHNELQLSSNTKVLKDVFFSPAHINDVCEAIHNVITHPFPGIFNYGSREGISKSLFSIEFARKLGFPLETMQEISLSELGLFARRPLDMTMNISLYEKKFLKRCPSIFSVINKCVQEYKK